MQLRPSLSVLKWTLVLVVLGSLLTLAYSINERIRRARSAETEADQAGSPKRAANSIVKLGAQLAESHGIKDEPAQSILWSPRVVVYGRVVPNPLATFEVRSPFGGRLRADPDYEWPAPGRWLRSGSVLGRLDIRASPQERLDIQTKLAEARAKEHGAEEVLKLQEDRAKRYQKLAKDQAISRRDLDDALIALAEARAQQATARTTVELWQRALDALQQHGDKSTGAWSEPLIASVEGEVTELIGRPGMAVEAGALIARVVDYRRPLVRLDLPAEVLATGFPSAQVELCAVPAVLPVSGDAIDHLGSATTETVVGATLVGPASQVEPASQLAGYWYEVQRPSEDGRVARPESQSRDRQGAVAPPLCRSRLCYRQTLYVKTL